MSDDPSVILQEDLAMLRNLARTYDDMAAHLRERQMAGVQLQEGPLFFDGVRVLLKADSIRAQRLEISESYNRQLRAIVKSRDWPGYVPLVLRTLIAHIWATLMRSAAFRDRAHQRISSYCAL